MRSFTEKGNILIITLVIFLMLAAGATAYFFGLKSGKFLAKSTTSPTDTASVDNTNTDLPPNNLLTPAPDKVPEANVIYLGISGGMDAIYYTNKSAQKYYENGIEKTNEYIGVLRKSDRSGEQPFDYRKLNNPRRLDPGFNYNLQDIVSLNFTDDKNFLYVSLNLEEKLNSQYPDNLVNRVYEIDLTDLKVKDVWSNELGSNKYPAKGAAAVISTAGNKFMDLQLGECYACGGHNQTKHIVVNMVTKAEKYMEMIGNIQFNIPAGEFSYQKLSEVKEPCEPGPGCDNGQMTFLKPSGSTFTEKLP